MHKIYTFLLLLLSSLNLFGFEITGNPMNWQKEDFIAFDEVGDCNRRQDTNDRDNDQ